MDINALQQHAAFLDDALSGKRLSKFVQLDIQLFSCKVDHKKSLVFCLSHGDPRVYYGESVLDGSGLSSTISSILRKTFANALVKKVSLINNDRIIRIDVSIVNEVFKQKDASLVIELIPNKPNLILLDEDNRIIYATKMTTLDDARPIVKGLIYSAPENCRKSTDAVISFNEEAYIADCLNKELLLIETKKKRKYSNLFSKAKNLKKSANRKHSLIQKDIEEAKLHLKDAEAGNMLLMYSEGLDCRSGTVDLDGYILNVDPRYSAAKNAELYFKRYKKAKATIAKGEENLKRAEKELEEAESLEVALSYGDEELLNSLLESDAKEKSSKKVQISAFLPYEYTLSEHRILIGKNSTQNDFLTFHFALDKDYYWFHVKDVPGAHVIIETSTPTKKELEFCCEFALLGSGLNSGEVQYAHKKTLRKGKAKGQVILGAYQSAYIRSISEETKKAYESIQRLKMRG